MAHYRHLNKAPITEAIIEIRFSPSPNVKVPRDLTEFCVALKESYPDQKPQTELKFEFLPGSSSPNAKHTELVSFRLSSSDGLQIVQAWTDRLTFSRLKPYQTWEHLREESRKVWDIYAKLIKPEAITRVATRFINSIEVSLPIRDFADYLVSAPIIPEKVPQGLASFYSRFVVPDPKTGATAIVTHALESLVTPNIAPVLIDIDVFLERSYETPEEAWITLNKLRDLKNLIFFESLTEKALEPYL